VTDDNAVDDILIVDDNEMNRRLLEYILTQSGYRVRTAEDAASAVLAIEQARPRLVLMDLQLPGKSGLDLTRELKQDPRTREIAIVAVTAYAMSGDREKALAAGCEDYVAKPVDKAVLRKVVERWAKKESTT
jgi:two-component system cell cycle response regulator DivK